MFDNLAKFVDLFLLINSELRYELKVFFHAIFKVLFESALWTLQEKQNNQTRAFVLAVRMLTQRIFEAIFLAFKFISK